MTSTFVYSDNIELVYQLLGKSLELSKPEGKISALTNESSKAQILLDYGASKVYISNSENIESLEMNILEVVKRESPDLLLIGSTRRGRELAPRLAAALNAGYAVDCFEIQQANEGLSVKRFTYGGSTIATEIITGKPVVLSAPNRAFSKIEPVQRKGEIIEISVPAVISKVKVVERRPKRIGDSGLETAKVIVSAGRGFKKREDLALLEELSKELGAKMGCTRPIAADLGWMDQWVGISGKKVSPRLYMACGISGTIQHAAGIRDSQIIVSINADEAAGIHEISDYSIVGDIYTIIPALTNALRHRK